MVERKMESESQPAVTKFDIERASLAGADLDRYVNLRDSGVPHSLSLRVLKGSDIDLPEFMRESNGLTRKQIADVATATFVYKLPSTIDGWPFDLKHSDLMTMSFRLIRTGVDSEDAVEISLKTLRALKECRGIAELDLDGIADAVIAAGRLKVKLQLEWKVAREVLRKWVDSWFAPDGNPQFTDRANLLVEMNRVFLIPIEQTVQFLSLEFNDFDLLVDNLVGYVPINSAPVIDPEEELTALSPVDMLEHYPDLFCSHLKNLDWPTGETDVKVFEGVLALCEELLLLEGFDFSSNT
jgi:hypothetical protein